MKKKIKLSKFEWVKKNIVIVPVVAAILAGTFTSVRYVINLTDTIEANKQVLINIKRDLKVEVEINGTGTHKYRYKRGPNRGKVTS